MSATDRLIRMCRNNEMNSSQVNTIDAAEQEIVALRQALDKLAMYAEENRKLRLALLEYQGYNKIHNDAEARLYELGNKALKP